MFGRVLFSQNYNPFLARNNYLVSRSADTFTPPSSRQRRAGRVRVDRQPIVGYLDGFSASDYPDNAYYLSTSHGVGPVPATNLVAILPNAYEPGRATVVVYNWAGSATQAVDLTGVMSPGAAYEIRNAQNFYGPPVVGHVRRRIGGVADDGTGASHPRRLFFASTDGTPVQRLRCSACFRSKIITARFWCLCGAGNPMIGSIQTPTASSQPGVEIEL